MRGDSQFFAMIGSKLFNRVYARGDPLPLDIDSCDRNQARGRLISMLIDPRRS